AAKDGCGCRDSREGRHGESGRGMLAGMAARQLRYPNPITENGPATEKCTGPQSRVGKVLIFSQQES
ncbi:MAG: hypothetical protein OXE57_00395, partial [Alphaproteobacteria bacterium]|nr:hypothetical protein [Alphaproteobacteria bacterium]